MSTPIAKSSGALSTNGTVVSGAGLLTYAQATGGTLTIYDGSTSGKRLATVSSSFYVPFGFPVQYNTSLYVTVSTTAMTGIVHYA